jgi:hypothetical protein
MRSAARLATSAAVLASALTLAGPVGAATAPTTLRLDGVGPLKLGMSRTAAVRTGWLSHRGTGCPLGGTPPITYRLSGPAAPRGLSASVEFSGGRLSDMSFSKGVRTARGVTVGKTTVATMVRVYRAAGFGASARYDSTFQGTFVTVRRNGKRVLGAFATGSRIDSLAIPGVGTCE